LAGPALGEHTEEVLLAAGYTPERIAELLTSGAAAGAAPHAPQAGAGSPPAPTFRV
jgi:alkylhydroperoxidase/carboxymuconolactone decarboxylase family protein YurZ